MDTVVLLLRIATVDLRVAYPAFLANMICLLKLDLGGQVREIVL